MMQHKLHKRFWIELLIWVAAEVALNLVGLDTLADYGEFMLDGSTRLAITRIDVTSLT